MVGVKISHRGTEDTEGLAHGARGELFTGCENHAEAQRARRIFLRWEILARRARRDGGAHIRENITQRHRGHRGHRGTRAWRARGIIYGMEKSRGGAEGAEDFFAVGNSRTEGTERRRGSHWGKYHTEAQRAHRGSRLAREQDFYLDGKITQRRGGRRVFFAVGNSRTEGTETRRGSRLARKVGFLRGGGIKKGLRERRPWGGEGD